MVRQVALAGLMLASLLALCARLSLADEKRDELVPMIVRLLGEKDSEFRAAGLDQVRSGAKGAEATKVFAAQLPKLDASAQALLGAALENSGKPQEAAAAYQAASDAADTPYLKADFLIQAGRAWGSAGDTAKAMAAYQRILDDFGEMPAVTEAKVRLSELTAATTATK